MTPTIVLALMNVNFFAAMSLIAFWPEPPRKGAPARVASSSADGNDGGSPGANLGSSQDASPSDGAGGGD